MLKIKILLPLILLAVLGGFGYYYSQHNKSTPTSAQSNSSSTGTKSKTDTTASAVTPAQNQCAGNTAGQLVIVSIGQQHMWACKDNQQVYETAVTTGASVYGDGTPTGTWQIQGKQTNRYLTGSDSRGSWNDFVKYWIPYNGDFGFHDSSWQTFPYGDLTKYQTDGSHGCVHMPLAAMAWLYNWAPIGTTVTIES